MKEKFKKLGRNFIRYGYIYTLLCLVLGLILTIWPNQAIFSIVLALLIGILLIGIAQVIYYFVSSAEIAREGLHLIKGLISIEAVGIFCLAYYLNLNLETIIFVSAMAVISSVRFQSAADIARKQYKIWYLFLSIAAIIILLACLPFLFKLSGTILYRIVGIVLLVEVVDDFMCKIILQTID